MHPRNIIFEEIELGYSTTLDQSRNSSDGVPHSQPVVCARNLGSIHGVARDLSLFQIFQTGTSCHPTYYSLDNGEFFPEIKWPEHETDHLPLSSTCNALINVYVFFLFCEEFGSVRRLCKSWAQLAVSKSDVWLTVHRNSVWIRKTN